MLSYWKIGKFWLWCWCLIRKCVFFCRCCVMVSCWVFVMCKGNWLRKGVLMRVMICCWLGVMLIRRISVMMIYMIILMWSWKNLRLRVMCWRCRGMWCLRLCSGMRIILFFGWKWEGLEIVVGLIRKGMWLGRIIWR